MTDEIKIQAKKAEAYDRIVEILRECSPETKKEVAEKIIDQDLSPL